MVKTIRRVGKKVNFDLVEKKTGLGKMDKLIRKKFSEIKKIQEILKDIHENPIKGIVGKERQAKKKQAHLDKMDGLFGDLNKVKFDELSREELLNFVKSQRNFIKDLLKNYKNSIKKEKQYVSKIKKI